MRQKVEGWRHCVNYQTLLAPSWLLVYARILADTRQPKIEFSCAELQQVELANFCASTGCADVRHKCESEIECFPLLKSCDLLMRWLEDLVVLVLCNPPRPRFTSQRVSGLSRIWHESINRHQHKVTKSDG